MSAESGRGASGSRGSVAATVPPQVVSDRSILDSAIGFINDVTLTNQPHTDPKDTITWARFETSANISDPCCGEDWELEGNVAPPLLLILGYGLGIQVWAIPANGEAVEVLSWRHGIVSALRMLPTPTTCSQSIETHGRADDLVDVYAEKRPLIAIVDGSPSAGSQPQFCSVNFVSLKTGIQVKTIKFKNPVLDIVANRSSIVITLHERIAVFDSRTIEDRLTITTCYLSPGINPNPVALGQRWLAYAEHKLLHSKRSGGGCDGEGVASYTATMLNAAKSLGKGLRELGEQVAAGLTGTTGSIGNSKSNSFDSQCSEAKQPGVITILDIKNPIKDYSPTSGTPMSAQVGTDPIIAHFIAHTEAIVAMDFDSSGMLLVTADRRGHDFHIFRIQPHPVGPSLAAVHHLYVLHRGDTSAKVQNIAFSLDSRWIAVSTLRGTTHVFPITPYGGPMGVRTHTSLHVVNKLSRFHRSAGLSAEGRSNSPISHSESTTFTQPLQPYHNPTLPPFPRPTVVLPLAQLRQPFVLGSPPGSAGLSIGVSGGGVGGGSGKSSSGGSSQRQRLSSLSDDNGKPLSVCAIFAKSRSWLLEPPNVTREAPHRIQRKAVDSLFVMAGHGALIQYDLDTKLASNVAKEKICDDTPIELEVEAKAQWNLGRRKEGSHEIMPPLSADNWLVRDRMSSMLTDSTRQYDDLDERAESWLSQVEIITHAGPHRRLWMGPQFVFKTYNAPSGSNLNLVDAEAIEIGVSKATTAAALARAERSSPLNITGRAAAVPVLIESGSYSSIEQSPKLMDRFRHDHLDSDFSISQGDTRLKEDLADAMRESPSVSSAQKDTGRMCSTDGGVVSHTETPTFYDAVAEHDTEPYYEQDSDSIDQTFDISRSPTSMTSAAAALASVLPNLTSYDTSSGYESMDSMRKPPIASIEKMVNAFGTVTTITAGMSGEMKTDMLDEVVSQLASEDCVIHENWDEALFRPVVAIFCDENERKRGEEEAQRNEKLCKPPEMVNNKLIVPVIAKEVDAELSKKEKEKIGAKSKQQQKDIQKAAAEKKEQSEKQQQQQQRVAKNDLKIDAKIDLKNDSKNDSKIDSKKGSRNESKKDSVIEVNNDSEIDSKNDSKTDSTHDPKTINDSKKDSKNDSKNNSKNDSKNNSKNDSKNDSKNESKNDSKKEQKEIKLETSQAPKEFTVKVVESTTSDKIVSLKESTTQKSDSSESEVSSKKQTVDIAKEKSETKVTKKEQIMTVSKSESSEKASTDNMEITFTAILPKGSNKTQTAISTSTTEKTTTEVKEKECAPKPAVVSEANKTPKPKTPDAVESPKTTSVIKTENLNAVELADSLIDLKGSYTEKPAKEPEKSSNSPITVPATKSSKKKKRSQSRPSSNSNSESEEVVVSVAAPQKSRKNKQRSDYETKERRSSVSSESSLGDLADSISEPLGKESSLFLSFLQTEEKKKKTSKLTATEEPEGPEEEEEEAEKDEKKVDTEIKKEKLAKPESNSSKTSKTEKDNESKVMAVKKNKNEAETKTNLETETSEKTKESKTPPPRSPKKKPTEGDKETVAATKPLPTSRVITQQPTKTKRDSISDDCDNSEKPVTVSDDKTKQSKDVTDGAIQPKSTTSSSSSSSSPQKSNPSPQPTQSAWKTMSGSELINKNLESFSNKSSSSINFPSLGDSSNKSSKKSTSTEKLLAEVAATVKSQSADVQQTTESPVNKLNKNIKSSRLDDFPLINSLEALPPLPTLEPLEVLAKDLKSPKNEKSGYLSDQVSLITFESPQQEDTSIDQKITRKHSGENLVYALCGSLHYEDENNGKKQQLTTAEEQEVTKSTAIKYKTYTNKSSKGSDKCLSSSPCSSASEEIIILEEKKMTKKQKRKRQQHQIEMQKSDMKSQMMSSSEASTTAVVVDEELRPLIDNMGDSQLYIDTMASSDHFGVSTSTTSNQLIDIVSTTTTTTTDSSEGPMPATTSDDNVFTLPAAGTTTTTTPHKMKTKKLEHKINLIAAIEAATSSSTSSAEESGVEGGGSGRASDIETVHHHHHSPLASSAIITTSTSSAMMALPTSLSVSAQLGGIKKKTKRRFPFSNHIAAVNVDAVDSKTNKFNNVHATTKSPPTQFKQQQNILDSSITSIAATKNKDIILQAFGSQQQQQQQQQYQNNIGEQSNIVNIDIFDDQLSTSSISSNSRHSLDAQTSSSLSLNGGIDTNLMHFPAGGDSVDDVRSFDGVGVGVGVDLDGVNDGASL